MSTRCSLPPVPRGGGESEGQEATIPQRESLEDLRRLIVMLDLVWSYRVQWPHPLCQWLPLPHSHQLQEVSGEREREKEREREIFLRIPYCTIIIISLLLPQQFHLSLFFLSSRQALRFDCRLSHLPRPPRLPPWGSFRN